MKNYFIKSGHSGWMVIAAPNKRKARTAGIAEFGRGKLWQVRVATENEVVRYLRIKGRIDVVEP